MKAVLVSEARQMFSKSALGIACSFLLVASSNSNAVIVNTLWFFGSGSIGRLGGARKSAKVTSSA